MFAVPQISLIAPSPRDHHLNIFHNGSYVFLECRREAKMSVQRNIELSVTARQRRHSTSLSLTQTSHDRRRHTAAFTLESRN